MRTTDEVTAHPAPLRQIIGEHESICRLRTTISRYAQHADPVLITGETGTGKELVARSLHQQSRVSTGTFVAVNCARLRGDMLEAELFGHRKGAFTGAVEHRVGLAEQAHDGTLFLDEIGDLCPGGQQAILRLLQEREVRAVGATRQKVVRVRFLAATHRDLDAMVASGEFRSDLRHRLHVLQLQVPPLRERRPDIPMIARTFLEHRTPRKQLSPCAEAWLCEQWWPGNVRDLQNALIRAHVSSEGTWITAAAFVGEVPAPAEPSSPCSSRDLVRLRRGWELAHGARLSEARVAGQLGLPRATWRSTLQRNGLTSQRLALLEQPPV